MNFALEMHALVTFGLIVNLIARFIGIIVSFDMYSKTKENRHFLQLLGWIFLLVSVFLPFGISLTQDLFIINLLRILNVITLNIGLFLLITGLSIYFIEYPRNMVISSLVVIILAPIIAFILLDILIAINISIIFQFLIIMVFLTLVYSNRKEIKNILQYSYGLIVILMVFLVGYVVVNVYIITRVPDYNYGLYMSSTLLLLLHQYSCITHNYNQGHV
ncbi:hypothetical protein [Candidatus Hodarchaeum mangrovi]